MELTRQEVIDIFKALAGYSELTEDDKYIEIAKKMLEMSREQKREEERKLKF